MSSSTPQADDPVEAAREAMLGPELYAKVITAKLLVVGAGESRVGRRGRGVTSGGGGAATAAAVALIE